eukprot:g3989.t1
MSSSSSSSPSDSDDSVITDNEEESVTDKSSIPIFPRTKNEILPHEIEEKDEDTKYCEQINELNASMAILKIGKILNVVDKNIVVQHLEDTEPLDNGSILCVLQNKGNEEARVPIGVIDEVFGPVSKPMYVVRSPKEQPAELTELLDKIDEIKSALNVYVVQQFAQKIDPTKLDTKGSDASNRYDEEVDEDEQDFSDDEKEANARNKHKNKNKSDNNGGNGNRRRV